MFRHVGRHELYMSHTDRKLLLPSLRGAPHQADALASSAGRAQAMAAYRTAARRFPGLHQPLVGMGMEYARMNNLALAEQLLAAAVAVCPYDALLLQVQYIALARMASNCDMNQLMLCAPDRRRCDSRPVISNWRHLPSSGVTCMVRW